MELRVDVRVWALAFVLVSGCAHGPPAGAIRLPGAIDFKGASGARAFRIEATKEGVRVEDANHAVMVELQLQEESMYVRGARGQLIAVILPPSDEHRGFRILSPDDRSLIFGFRSEPDGDLKLVGANDELVSEVKRRDYGFKVVDRNGEVESRLRLSPGKISVRSPSGETFLYTRDPMSPEAAAAITLDQLRFEFAAGLAVAIMHWSWPAN